MAGDEAEDGLVQAIGLDLASVHPAGVGFDLFGKLVDEASLRNSQRGGPSLERMCVGRQGRRLLERRPVPPEVAAGLPADVQTALADSRRLVLEVDVKQFPLDFSFFLRACILNLTF